MVKKSVKKKTSNTPKGTSTRKGMKKKNSKKVSRSPSKKTAKRSSKKVQSKKVSTKAKMKLNKYLINSVILLAISIALYAASPMGLWSDVFYMAIIVFGSLTLAFVIVLLIQFFLRALKK